MARNAPSKIKQDQEQTGVEQPMKGGALGVPEPARALTALPQQMLSSLRRQKADAGPQARQWRVVGGPAMITYRNSRMPLKIGRVMSEASCDVDLLRRQGVMFEEVVRAPKPVDETGFVDPATTAAE
jgi:hypothetical protein